MEARSSCGCAVLCMCVFQWARLPVFTNELRPFATKIVTERCLLICVILFVL